MACYHPLQAYRTSDGSVVFQQLRRYDVIASISLPCGQCVGCRLERSRQWAMRCLHEASLYDRNCFITLTYSEEKCPLDGSLNYSHFQNFMKRLRFKYGRNIRFYMCGEYGPLHGRPHYHACLFNHDFSDRELWKTTQSGSKLYRSAELEQLWPDGFSSVGEVNFESAAYVARYIMKKITGDMAKIAYASTDPETGEITFATPEFNHMSLKPGIGARWLEKYCEDVFPVDYIVVRGIKMKPPKYYDKLIGSALNWYPEYCDLHAEHDEFTQARILRGRANFLDNTDSRLAVRETVASARLNLYSRKVE